MAALEGSIAGDGQSFYVALEIVPNMPIPVTASVTLPQQAITPAVGTSPAAVMAVLERGLEQTRAEMWPTAKRFDTTQSAVLRLHRRVPIPGNDSEETVDGLVADYWMTVPGTKRFVLVSFSTAFGPLEDTMLGFFDSLIGVAGWSTTA